MKFCVTRSCKPMTRSDSRALVTRLDQVMHLTLLEKISDDSDSKSLWLWLEKNDSDTSLVLTLHKSQFRLQSHAA